MSEQNPHVDHARYYMAYAIQHAEARYRAALTDVYEHAMRFTAQFLGGRQSLPHFRFGTTASRRLSNLSNHTGHGARYEITLNEGLAIDVNPSWVLIALPSPRTRRFIHGLVERELVRQNVREVEKSAEAGYEGFGPRFCAAANRIGLARGWKPVIPRRRGAQDADALLGRSWPHGPELAENPLCYGNDVTQAAIDLVLGGGQARNGRAATPLPPIMGCWEYVLYLLSEGRVKAVSDIAALQVDRLRAVRKGGLPVLPRFEAGAENDDGTPIKGDVVFDPEWLAWNGGTVRSIAEGIHEFRSYAEMPILADALWDAGCGDERILGHLRTGTKGHCSRCWVIRNLLA